MQGGDWLLLALVLFYLLISTVTTWRNITNSDSNIVIVLFYGLILIITLSLLISDGLLYKNKDLIMMTIPVGIFGGTFTGIFYEKCQKDGTRS